MTEIYEYKKINVTHEPGKPTIESAANRWAAMGWRTVSVIPAIGPGYADSILVERKKTSRGRRTKADD